ncbi:Ferric-chelate reductase 1 [Orchesella cincta]|uniref:ascorbate ferrireductase (transmembrane) n=1 Tax=Orchesella cincta TaxID=48709 RepID=A0A1D2N198_ORCCI|nr:Ferric-chelate reductase 1 [Orchesella cincta]
MIETKLRTNSIQDFCFLTDILSDTAAPSPQGPPLPPRTTSPNYKDFKAPTNCYAPPATLPPIGQNPVHSAGNNPNWAILEHLVRHKAQSFQAYDDLPYVYDYYKPNRLITWPPDTIHTLDSISPPLPKPRAPNPYFVEVTGISFKGELLHNYLHFRIFANLSVALGKGQLERSEVLHPNNASGEEKPNHVTGKISALVIMVKDQNGWPIGDFSTAIPCLRTCTEYSHDIYYGDERNAVPCSYTPPHASSYLHPGMFVFDVDPGRYCTSDLPYIKGGDAATPPTEPDPRLNPQTKRLEGVREVHATWSFGHNTCNFAQRLYIQTLLFEDVETVYPAYLRPETKFPDEKADGTFDKLEASDASFLFGWTAQYYILKPTWSSLGAPDYVNLKYLRERDERSNEVDCHVPLFDAVDPVQSSFQKFAVPSHDAISDPNNAADSSDIRVPTRNGYNSALWGIYMQSAASGADKKVRYFGQHRGETDKCNANVPEKSWIVDENAKTVIGEELPPSATTFFQKENGVRCPCPALPSTLPPEKRTADPARVHGRLIHASHMAIAYMLLTPIGCFVARYYKETFVTIFCFQEYWWFMWHVVFLLAACLFNIGAITSIARKKESIHNYSSKQFSQQADLVYNENLIFHVIFGAISIFIFYMEIITGFFRVSDPKKRMRQIFMHWLIGTMNNACAVMSMFAMAFVNQSGFSCKVAYTTIFWLLFVITCYVLMELDMRKADKKLHLVPRRTYLPPPVKRLFTKEPPGREFRLAMLAIFIFGLMAIQFLISYFIWETSDAISCQEEWIAYDLKRRRFKPNPSSAAGGGGPAGGDGGYTY